MTTTPINDISHEIGPESPSEVFTNSLVAPYFMDAHEVKPQFRALLQQEPFLEGRRFDGQTFRIFINSSADPLSAPAKSLDATVREKDKNWQDSRDRTVKSLERIQDNSFYFTYVNTSDSDNPSVTGTLMVSDLSKGGESETISYFKSQNPGKELPEVFSDSSIPHRWDIVSVMTDLESRDGITSAYLYHALYKAACETVGLDPVTGKPAGQMTWISSLSAAESKNLQKYLGIPFKPISGTAPTYEEVPEGKPVEYRFCSLKIEDIYESTGGNILERELTGKSMQVFIAKLARIALLGTEDPSVKDLDPRLLRITDAA